MTPHQNRPVRAILLGVLVVPIRLYRWFVSPLFPQACRFDPTCSEYAIEAITQHGATRGIGLAARRLARCHPIAWLGGSQGFDPVPPAQKDCSRNVGV